MKTQQVDRSVQHATWTRLSSRRFAAAVLAASLLAAEADAQVVGRGRPGRGLAVPTGFTAVPDYGDGEIDLKWTDLAGETGYEIHRAEYGEAPEPIATVGANVTTYSDGTAVATKEYVYKVVAIYGAKRSPASAAQRQNLKTIWPVPESREVLHGWNDTIGIHGQWGSGFHLGIDIQRVSGTTEVIAAQGGIVTTARNHSMGTNTNGLVNIRVQNGPAQVQVQTNHVTKVTVAAGQNVYAGQKIGEISEGFFSPDWVDHTHFMIITTTNTVVAQHPLTLFSSDADRDPKMKAPALVDDLTPAGSILFREQGGAYLTPGDPLHGDIDIVVEIADEMGTSPMQIPVLLAYFIEPPPPVLGVTHYGVKDGLMPYVLFNTVGQCFGCFGAVPADALALMKRMVDDDASKNYGASITGFPWQNYKHYTVTNADGTAGLAADVKDTEFWNTNAKDDASIPTGADANFAGKPDTDKATEARFPDGDYKINIHASDLVNNSSSIEHTVRLENYPPIVVLTDPAHGETLPAGTDEVANLRVIFNEPMDMTVGVPAILGVSGGATLHDMAWLNAFTIGFTLKDMENGGTYTLSVSPAAKDRPGAPGGKPLDGNKDGVGGDPHMATFSVGT